MPLSSEIYKKALHLVTYFSASLQITQTSKRNYEKPLTSKRNRDIILID